MESAGFNGRLPEAITLFLCSMDGYLEVNGDRIKTCQAVVFGVGHCTRLGVFVWVCEQAKGELTVVLAVVMIGSQEARKARNSILSCMDITLKANSISLSLTLQRLMMILTLTGFLYFSFFITKCLCGAKLAMFF